jgi:hypothetical protein
MSNIDLLGLKYSAMAAREAPCFFAFAQLVISRFRALFLRPSSAANQIHGVKGALIKQSKR